MASRRSTRLVLGALVGLFIVSAAAPAGARIAAAGPGGFAAGFATPIVVTTVGGTVTFFNSDIASHNFVAAEDFVPKKLAKSTEWCASYEKGKCPLFWTPTITAGQQTDVLGLDLVKSGETYAFVCSLHPNMRGALVVG
ncbi:MAG TPA: plastocyanin/azurin family copper-binding protein [Actinomycetota bacterium]|nr:plastocyanin/azurin family copper-binding protein [Actinomycetota bacterium]